MNNIDDMALEEQSPEARRLEFEELAARHALSNQAIGKMLDRDDATICRYRRGASEIPPVLLSSLRRIVAAIDAAK